MRSKKAIVPAADLPCCTTARAASCALRTWLCGVLVLVALSACGSVQTTTSGNASSLPQSVSNPEPPVITGNPPTAAQIGVPYDYTPTVSDSLSTAPAFLIANRPSWANFNASTGQLSGTPSSANVGSYPKILISVSDGTLTASFPAFTITVSAVSGNGLLTISGNPEASVNAGSAYTFTPSASDAEDLALTFSIQNQPAWAAFNPSTGQLSGTPTAADVGSYANIAISVSNGVSVASLAAFTITVTQISTGTVTVNWIPPTQNTNGTPLVNLAGFRILYGRSANDLNQTAQIANPGVTSYVLADLAPGTWYIGIMAYTASGVESSLSNLASTTVP